MSVNSRRRPIGVGVLGILSASLVVQFGCTLDNPKAPELAGPSELGTSIEMRAIPDQLTADGFSSSVIEAVVRNENGERKQGVEVLFDLTSPTSTGAPGTPGGFIDLGNLSPLNGPRPTAGGVEPTSVSAVTDGDGVARARYWAPFRSDQVNDTTVTVTGRPAGTNFNAAIFRTTAIFLRAADRPSFPGTNICGFTIEPSKIIYAIGEPLAFTATQSIGDDSVDGCLGNPIARYEWTFSDGTYAVDRGTVHAFAASGTFTVFLVTTESGSGCRATCSATIDVAP
jgi:PKD domain